MAVSRALRFQVLRRDGYRCHYCGATAADAKLTVDHVTAVALGGTDTADNLVTACEPCNGGKSATPADAALVAQVQERDAQFRAAVADVAEDDRQRRWFTEAFLEAWNLGELPPGWRKTIDAYRQQGLTSDIWDEIVSIARSKTNLDDPFRYCCGIARNHVKKIQTEAAKQAARPTEESLDDSDRKNLAIQEAAVACWYVAMGGDEEDLDPAVKAAFWSSFDELDQMDFLDPGRIVSAADYGGNFGVTTIKQALRDVDFRDAYHAWTAAWPQEWIPADDSGWGGRWEGGPDDDAREWASQQMNALLDAGVHVSRVVRAATYAGFHESARIYCGLTSQELEASGLSGGATIALELWRVTRTAGGRPDPTKAELHQFFDGLRTAATADPSLLNIDFWQAAAWAGAYQDSDIATCLTVHDSVFEAAAALAAPSSSE